jgi:hypothetical protein
LCMQAHPRGGAAAARSGGELRRAGPLAAAVG